MYFCCVDKIEAYPSRMANPPTQLRHSIGLIGPIGLITTKDSRKHDVQENIDIQCDVRE